MRRRILALFALAVAAAAAAALPAAGDLAPSGTLYGRTIASLTFDGDAAVDQATLARLTDLRVGQTLTEAAVREAMRNLFATRRFSDLAIEASGVDARVAVRVTFSAAPRIAAVRLTGVRLLDRGRARDALGLEVGESWAPERGEAAQRGLTRVLRERGFFVPAIRMRVGAGPDEASVVLDFDVDTGPLAHAAPALFSGSTSPFSAAELEARMKLKPGRAFRESRARDDADRLTAFLHGRGFARAEVRFESASYDAAARTAQARYALFVGPKVVLEVKGASVASVRNHPDSPWSRGEPPDEEAIRKLRESLVRSYQEKGYAEVVVQASLHTEPGEDRVEVSIQKGARFAIEKVGFSGAHSVPSHELASVLKTRPRGLIAAGRLVARELEEDRGTLAAVYASHGFPDARAEKPEVGRGARPFTLDVTFRVEEGAPVLVADRRVDGNLHVPTATLLPLLSVAAGQPYTKTRVAADEASLQGWYLSHGYPDVRVTAETRLEPPVPPRPLAATVLYHLFEGDEVFFGKTVVRGNSRTKTSVIEGEFAHDQGQPFALTKLIDTQQALTRLGVFSRMEVTFFPTDPETHARTVLITLAEAKPWSLLYGVGAEYDPAATGNRFNPRGSLGVTYSNLFGRALVAGIEGRWSNRDRRIVASLRAPSLLFSKVPVSFTIFRARQYFQSFNVTRSGAFLEVERRLSSTVRAAFRYQYEIVEPQASAELLTSLERQNQKEKISSLAPGITYDTRNDPVDPHGGILASMDVKYAFPLWSADARFVRGLLQAAVYRPFQGTVLALSARVGAIESFAACDPVANPSCAPNLEVPIVERFFAGGRTTHRAFALDQLGIPGQTLLPDANGNLQPSGGNGMALANLEWRIPVVGDLGVSLFVDYGNVFADYRHMRLSKMRTGVGVGLHYLTPVGPLRLEYGWKADRKEDESAGALSFSVGYPF